ncbi:hypothetical protein D3C80_1870730 [compost metagenome]
MLGLHTDDADIRPQVFDVRRDTGDQAAAPHRNENRIQRPLVLAQDFHGHGALAGDHIRVVEGRDEGATGLPGQVQGVLQGERETVAMQQRIRATATHSDDLERRG